MRYLIILNDPPYGTERSYNGLRLADSLCKDEETSQQFTVSVVRQDGSPESCRINH
jgi:uncharacterized protein involved in oxidation of intracellular sulfur